MTDKKLKLNALELFLIKALFQKEKEILGLIKKGMSSKNIAATLYISVNTVNRHRQNILEKLSVSYSIKACRAAKAMKLL